MTPGCPTALIGLLTSPADTSLRHLPLQPQITLLPPLKPGSPTPPTQAGAPQLQPRSKPSSSAVRGGLLSCFFYSPGGVCRGFPEPRQNPSARSPCSAPGEIPPALVRTAPLGNPNYREGAGKLADVINHPLVCSGAKSNSEGGESFPEALHCLSRGGPECWGSGNTGGSAGLGSSSHCGFGMGKGEKTSQPQAGAAEGIARVHPHHPWVAGTAPLH